MKPFNSVRGLVATLRLGSGLALQAVLAALADRRTEASAFIL